MKQIACSVLASLLLLSACDSKTTTTPTATAEKSAAAPAEKPAAAPTPKPAAAPAEKPAVKPAEKPAEKPAATPAEKSAAAPAESPKPAANADMNAAIKALMAKPELPDDMIEIQHILISFQGAPRMRGVTRSKEEAQVLAEKVYAELIGGGDFDALVKQYTNDSAPGIYKVTKAARTDWVKGFGDVGFRLKVGEIGVAPWDASASPFGWHIVKRLK